MGSNEKRIPAEPVQPADKPLPEPDGKGSPVEPAPKPFCEIYSQCMFTSRNQCRLKNVICKFD